MNTMEYPVFDGIECEGHGIFKWNISQNWMMGQFLTGNPDEFGDSKW